MLDGLTQADAAGVRADRYAELGGQQQVGNVLVDATDPGGIDLHDGHAAGLQQLLEDDPVLHMLTGGDPDGRDAFGDRGMTKDVVGAGRFFHPGRLVGRRSCRSGSRRPDSPG